jgi:uncharacterized protein YjbI with pentapeptide repeats/uncharacterized membrane protein
MSDDSNNSEDAGDLANTPSEITCSNWQVVHDELSRNIKVMTRVLLVACVYSVLKVTEADERQLVLNDGKIDLPLVSGSVSFWIFVIIGPLIIILTLYYLHIFLNQLKEHSDSKPEDAVVLPYLFNLDTFSSKFLSLFLFHAVPILSLSAFIYKTNSFHIGIRLLLVAITSLTYYLIIKSRFYLSAIKKDSRLQFIAESVVITFGLLSGSIYLVNNFGFEYVVAFFTGFGLILLAILYSNDDNAFTKIGNFCRSQIIPIKTLSVVVTTSTLAGFSPAITLEGNEKVVNFNLSYSNFEYAKLNSIEIRNTDLRYSNLKSSSLVKTNLQYSNLKGADLEGAKLDGANLHNTNLRAANFQDASLRKASLVGAKLSKTNFENADLTESKLMNIQFRSSILTNAILSGADLSYSNLKTINLDFINLENAVLVRANLNDTSFFEAKMKGTNLENAYLRSSFLQKADLSNANLRNADLEGANLWEVNLSNADLYMANIKNTKYLECESLVKALNWEDAIRSEDLSCNHMKKIDSR